MSDSLMFAEQALRTVLQLSLHASVVVLAVLLIQGALRKRISARSRYALWSIVVARLLIPWNYELPVVTETIHTPISPVAAPDQTPRFIDLNAREISDAPEVPMLHTTTPIKTATSTSETQINVSPPPPAETHVPNPWTLAALAWMSGLVLIPTVITLNQRRTARRLLQESTAPPAWVLQTLQDLRSEFRLVTHPEVLMTTQLHSPTLLGVRHPKILLPKKLIESSSPEEVRLFLLHELTHLRTGDLWLSWLWCLTLSVHWFNPLLWWAGTRIRKDREFACDEAVLRRIGPQANDQYANALVSAIAHTTDSNVPRYRFGLVGIAEDKTEITRRIEAILNPTKRSKRYKLLGALTLAAVLCLTFVKIEPVKRIVEAQEPSEEQSNQEDSPFIQAVDAEMLRIKERLANGNAYADKADLNRLYDDLKIQRPNLTESELESIIQKLGDYRERGEHSGDDSYQWRIWYLQSIIAQDTKDEIDFGDQPPSMAYLWEATLHYPYTRYEVPSKHSKFQHLVNEMGMRIWDTKGLDAAEKYLVDTWKNDRRFVYFFDNPWRQRMEAEGVPIDRLAKITQQLGDKPDIPLKKIEFLLTPNGLFYEGNKVTDFEELKSTLAKLPNPQDRYIAMGISTEDVTLKEFRTTSGNLHLIVEELKFDHFSDIGLQTASDSISSRQDTRAVPTSVTYAWNNENDYQPPSFDSFFPDDPQGGRALDIIWNMPNKDALSDTQILYGAQIGLRTVSRQTRTNVIRWIGQKYIWGKSPQNPRAIEIMYHAADFSGPDADPYGTRHWAVYFGLSVVEEKTPSILHTLVDLCMNTDDPNDLHRVAWGASSQRDELLTYLQPYLESDDETLRAKADIRKQIFLGELKAFDWAREQARLLAEKNFTSRLPELKDVLTRGDSSERKEALNLIQQNSISLIMDDSFIAAFDACANDPDKRIRNDVTRIAGNQWVWSAEEQNPQAIELLLRLSRDTYRDARYNAVYFGLSTVREKSDTIIRRLLEMAFEDREPNLYRRIAWGLKRDSEKVAKILEEYINGSDENLAKNAQDVYKDMVGREYHET